MQVCSVRLTRLVTPFRQAFAHAAARREQSDAIIIEIVTDRQVSGFGEIQARPYVSGEDNEHTWTHEAPSIARRLIGCPILRQADIPGVLGGTSEYLRAPAAVGGFDVGLWDAFDLCRGVEWSRAFGARRTSSAGTCMTLGHDVEAADLERAAKFARISRCAAVKLKVAGPEDADRAQRLRHGLGPSIELRLDANGELDPVSALDLLRSCKNLDIHSIEEPLNKQTPDLVEQLEILHASTGIAFVADESVCTTADFERFAKRNAYQFVNVRIGKCGGIFGSAALIKAIRQSKKGIVGGTMVGETEVLLRASRKMLEYTEQMRYIEGIDQARKMLVEQAIEPVHGDERRHFRWRPEAAEKFIVGQETVD